MIEEIRIFVTVKQDNNTEMHKHFSTTLDENSVDKAIELLKKVKEKPIKKPEEIK